MDTGEIAELASLDGPTIRGSSATAIDERGTIASSAGDPEAGRAVLWRDGQITALGSFGGERAGYAINEHGVIAGASTNRVHPKRP